MKERVLNAEVLTCVFLKIYKKKEKEIFRQIYLWYNYHPLILHRIYTIRPCVDMCHFYSWVNIFANNLCQNILPYKLEEKIHRGRSWKRKKWNIKNNIKQPIYYNLCWKKPKVMKKKTNLLALCTLIFCSERLIPLIIILYLNISLKPSSLIHVNSDYIALRSDDFSHSSACTTNII